MKKLFSFSLFAAIVILAIVARSTAKAKPMDVPGSPRFIGTKI